MSIVFDLVGSKKVAEVTTIISQLAGRQICLDMTVIKFKKHGHGQRIYI